MSPLDLTRELIAKDPILSTHKFGGWAKQWTSKIVCIDVCICERCGFALAHQIVPSPYFPDQRHDIFGRWFPSDNSIITAMSNHSDWVLLFTDFRHHEPKVKLYPCSALVMGRALV